MPKKQTEWSRTYNERAYDRLAITVPKGKKQLIDAYAKNNGLSVNGLVNELLQKEIGLSNEEWNAKEQEGCESQCQ